MHSMTNKTFVVRTDENGSRYICKAVDEFTKNHWENDKQFRDRISELCSLSTKYTNYCIRATGVTLLSRSMFNPAQIMAVTGHASVSSLAVYQRVSDSEKVAMGKAIASSIDKSLVPMDNKDDDLFQSIDV